MIDACKYEITVIKKSKIMFIIIGLILLSVLLTIREIGYVLWIVPYINPIFISILFKYDTVKRSQHKKEMVAIRYISYAVLTSIEIIIGILCNAFYKTDTIQLLEGFYIAVSLGFILGAIYFPLVYKSKTEDIFSLVINIYIKVLIIGIILVLIGRFFTDFDIKISSHRVHMIGISFSLLGIVLYISSLLLSSKVLNKK